MPDDQDPDRPSPEPAAPADTQRTTEAPALRQDITAEPAEPAGPAAAAAAPAATTTKDRPARAPSGELLSVGCALVLFVVFFAAKWYGVIQLPRKADRTGSETATSAWNQLADIRWVVLLLVLVTIGSVVVHVSQRSHGAQTDVSRVIGALATVTSILLAYRVLIALPSPHSVVDAKIGAYVGLLAAIGVALGAFESGRARRAQRQRPRPRTAPRDSVATGPPAR